MTSLKKKKQESPSKAYSKFGKLDGSHSLKSVSSDCFVDYKARKRSGAKVVYFNFELACEMGLISKDHEDIVNSDLESTLIDTFALMIINEYDIENNKVFPKDDLKKGSYMATRYLQLQHPNKQGKTSGDGRSIWNGEIKSNGKSWDVTSCGTGATILSPATHIHGKNFESGDPSISYGCGYAEVDEGIETLLFSEVLHLNRLKTERVLAILKFSDGFGITVRAHENLMRPSHFFGHLKQGNLKTLKALTDYYIEKQIIAKNWTLSKKDNKYDLFLSKMSQTFAQTAAKFEDEYIFCWLDWDGDNILMDGGIIDYGSVRQFGLFHHEYRFDDDSRYSTNILEQKNKARYTVQCFAQQVDFLKTGKKKSLGHFSKHSSLKEFDKSFERAKKKNLLTKMGLPVKIIDQLLEKKFSELDKFIKVFSYFERSKSTFGLREVNDGITVDAIFCMRDILRELPQLLLARGENIKSHEFIEIIKSNYAQADDLKISTYRNKKIIDFQNLYQAIVKKASKYTGQNYDHMLLQVSMRSSVINKYDRVTGDSISVISAKIMKDIKKLKSDHLYQIVKNFSHYQNLNPDSEKRSGSKRKSKRIKGFMEVVKDFREGL